MHARTKGVVRVQHCADTTSLGKPALRYGVTFASCENQLDAISFNVITCNLHRIDYGAWAEIKGDLQEGTRGAMADILTDHFKHVETPEEDITAYIDVDIVGRLHSKFLRLEECIVVESRGSAGQYFIG